MKHQYTTPRKKTLATRKFEVSNKWRAELNDWWIIIKLLLSVLAREMIELSYCYWDLASRRRQVSTRTNLLHLCPLRHTASGVHTSPGSFVAVHLNCCSCATIVLYKLQYSLPTINLFIEVIVDVYLRKFSLVVIILHFRIRTTSLSYISN